MHWQTCIGNYLLTCNPYSAPSKDDYNNQIITNDNNSQNSRNSLNLIMGVQNVGAI